MASLANDGEGTCLDEMQTGMDDQRMTEQRVTNAFASLLRASETIGREEGIVGKVGGGGRDLRRDLGRKRRDVAYGGCRSAYGGASMRRKSGESSRPPSAAVQSGPSPTVCARNHRPCSRRLRPRTSTAFIPISDLAHLSSSSIPQSYKQRLAGHGLPNPPPLDRSSEPTPPPPPPPQTCSLLPCIQPVSSTPRYTRLLSSSSWTWR